MPRPADLRRCDFSISPTPQDVLEKWWVAFSNRRWAVALLATWLLYVMIVSSLGDWQYIGVPAGMRPIFADWHAVLIAADCHKLGRNVFVENPCDNWARPHVYGSLWLQLGRLGLGVRDVFWLGLLINAAFMLLAVVLINPLTVGELLLGVAILLSPAIMLAIERANSDLIIFGLVVLAAWLVAGHRRYGQIGGLLVTSLSVFLKFYPAVLFGIIALVARNRKQFLIAVIGGLCLLAVWLYLSVDEL